MCKGRRKGGFLTCWEPGVLCAQRERGQKSTGHPGTPEMASDAASALGWCWGGQPHLRLSPTAARLLINQTFFTDHLFQLLSTCFLLDFYRIHFLLCHPLILILLLPNVSFLFPSPYSSGWTAPAPHPTSVMGMSRSGRASPLPLDNSC